MQDSFFPALILLVGDDGWMGPLALVAFGALAFCFFFRSLRLRRLVETIPTSKCRSIAMGLVEVAGQAAGAEPFVSSFTGLPCYISRLTVEQESGDEWRKIHSEERSVSFCVEDDTGRVQVDPAGADLDHIHKLHYDFEGALRAPPGMLERMRLAGVTADTFKQALETISKEKKTRKLRLCQQMIRPGDPVYVLGSAEERVGGVDEHERIVIRKGKFHPWFVVASGSQKDVLAGLKLTVIWLLVSVTAILGGLWMLLEGV